MQDAASPDELPAACANCGSRGVARFCPECGQDQRSPVRSLKPWAEEFFDNTFNLDSRLWHTLRPLMARPGLLTADYIAGRRARYVPPLKLYVFASLAFFLLAALLKDPGSALVVDTQDRDAAGLSIPGLDAGEHQPAAPGTLAAHMQERMRRLSQDPRGFSRALFDRFPAALFLFVPVVAAVLKLLYLRSRRYYVEHLVLSLHNHSFAFVALTGGLLLGQLLRLAPGQAGSLAFAESCLYAWAAVYLWLSMRRVYAQSRAVTTLKFAALLVVAYGMLLIGAMFLTVIYTLLVL